METTKPVCPYFGACGGCAYQDLSYADELSLKEKNLKRVIEAELGLANGIFHSIIPSPEPYAYRSRLDLSLRRIQGGVRVGFNREGTRRLVDIESCAIARREISVFIPVLREAASRRLPENYRSANLVVKTGEGGEVRWGGIGRKSLRLSEAEYFWTEIEGKRIFYSLDCFFQANLGILPEVIQTLRSLLELNEEKYLLDLYAGVGLFWVVLASEVKGVQAVEESGASMRVAEFNRRYHELSHVVLREGKTEDQLEKILKELEGRPQAAIVDPPRQGLSRIARERLIAAQMIDPLIYISCHPEALLRDLKEFLQAGWKVDQVIPFDFFPRTRHLEVVARLRPAL